MQRAGEVVGVTQGVAVVRCPDGDHPRLGGSVLDDNLNTVGRIVDVFGPVDRPFLAVSPATNVRLPTLLGSVLYYRDD